MAEVSESVRAAVLAEVAADLESMRQPNPMNGDASNYMLTRCLNAIVRRAGEERDVVISAVREVQDRRAAEDLARYKRLLREPTAHPTASAGLAGTEGERDE